MGYESRTKRLRYCKRCKTQHEMTAAELAKHANEK